MSKGRTVSFETKNGKIVADRKTGAWYLTEHGNIIEYGTTHDLPAFLTAFRPDFGLRYEQANFEGGD